ncbi:MULTISPECIES: hypothetical protein [unclassified Pseudomonas]|uniref:hypothetical protein n=1 Tax=unclassified Pseudomonas TaxID=196821 RepID=UPI0014824EA9|nr:MULTISPECIES: hypothetical protein [unclassified Pseudomonas]
MSDRSSAHGIPRFPWDLDASSLCDQCGKWRVQGSHAQCSRTRQLLNAHRRKQPPKR